MNAFLLFYLFSNSSKQSPKRLKFSDFFLLTEGVMNHILTPRIRHLKAKSTRTVIQKYNVPFLLQALCSEEFTVETFAIRLNFMEAFVLWQCQRDRNASVKFISFLMEKVYQPVVSWKEGLFWRQVFSHAGVLCDGWSLQLAPGICWF